MFKQDQHKGEGKMNIRLETTKDYKEVENLTREAFWNVYRPGCTEHLVLHNLRRERCFVKELSYLIEVDSKIIAHIAYAQGSLELASGGKTPLLLFGPVSVLPQYQKKGYGSALIRFTLDKAKQLGYAAVVITGSPDYYSRFGFVPASKHGIYYNGASEPSPFFMVKLLDESAAESLKGIYSDPPCYYVDDAEVEKFDKNFEPKIKKSAPAS